MGKRSELVGKKFNRLTVIKFSHSNQYSFWECKCDCGKQVTVRGSALKAGATKSCGCLQKEWVTGLSSKINDKTRLPLGECSFNVLYSRYTKQAEKRGLKFELSREEFKKLTSSDCFYCGIKPLHIEKPKGANGEYLYNGIDRKDNKNGYLFNNCVSCCGDCNWLKGSLQIDVFIEQISKIAKHLIFNK